jgi:hypothetical protein
MANKFYGILSVILFFFLSKSCITDYTHRYDNDGALKTYEKMVSENSFVTGRFDSTYQERVYKSKKTGSVRRTEYDLTYRYSLEGETYLGKHTFQDIRPTEVDVKVYYLSDNPSFSCLNPQERLSKGKEKRESKSDLYWGIAFGIICLLSLVGFISELKEKKPIRETKPNEAPNDFTGY